MHYVADHFMLILFAQGVNESLTSAGVKQSNIFTTYVPGAFELPVTAKFLAMSKRVDVIICLGCLIKGDTMHFEYIAGATANGIMQVSLESLVPCLFGVLTVLDKQQAIDRSFGPKNEGWLCILLLTYTRTPRTRH